MAPTENLIESLASGQSFAGQKLRLVVTEPPEPAAVESPEKPASASVEEKISWAARIGEQAASLSEARSVEARTLGQGLLADLGAYRFAEIRPLLKAHYRAQVGRARQSRPRPARPAAALAEEPAPAPLKPMFAERFCAQHRLAPERCQEEIFRRTLYPRARILAPLVRFFNAKHFAADRDLVQGVAQLRSRDKLADEIAYFRRHPWNRGFWRQTLHLRISVRRMEKLVAATFSGGA
jgi:hypothetical protein